LPVTDETRDRLREQANQLGSPTVVRLIDLLHVAVEDMRQDGDPRLPLELALVKVTRPGSDLSREAIAYRLDRLEQGAPAGLPRAVPSERAAVDEPPPAPEPPAETGATPAAAADAPGPPSLELEQLQEAWQRTILPAVEERSIPAASVLREAHPAGLADGTLTVEFPSSATFHRQLAEEPKNATLLAEALYEVTGRHLGLAFAEGEAREEQPEEDEGPAGEEKILELVKETLDARERED
jgi:DNA polymerase III subunit gamma/tau